MVEISPVNRELAKDSIKAQLETNRIAADRDFDIMCLQEMKLAALNNVRVNNFDAGFLFFGNGGCAGGGFCGIGGFV